jgi:hypothetical protein
MIEGTGTVAKDVSPNKKDFTYDGATLVDDITPFGDPCPSFDGVNDRVYETSVTGIGEYNKGSCVMYMFVPTAAWAGGFGQIMTVQGSNAALDYVRINKTSTADQLAWQGRFGNTQEWFRSYIFSTGEKENWFQIGFSWDTGGDTTFRGFINGNQEKSATSLLTSWTAANDVATIYICADGTTNYFEANVAHFMLTDTQLLEADFEWMAREARII